MDRTTHAAICVVSIDAYTWGAAASSLREPLPARRLRPVGFVERGAGVGAGGFGAGFAR